jgi:hypothetical protein
MQVCFTWIWDELLTKYVDAMVEYKTFSELRAMRVALEEATSTSRKMDINTGSRGPFVPEIKPVQKIRDKSPPTFGTGSLQTGIKGASTLAPRRVQG